ncbi:MAG TPA: polyprenyl synthetase family protein, partial [Bradyrhizobium sp.]|nr:polyprenyl synthetase family protein [Bradyrhizobium sp.]
QEVENAFNLQLTEADHFKILARKTGALIVLSCSLGAELARAPPPVAAALADYGRHLGLAFQLADDALDLVGSPEQMGKLAGTDLRGGVFSFPILRVLGRRDAAAARLSKLLRQIELNETDVCEIVAIVQETGAVGEAQTMAREFSARACGALASLPAGAARTSFERLAAYAVTRSR